MNGYCHSRQVTHPDVWQSRLVQAGLAQELISSSSSVVRRIGYHRHLGKIRDAYRADRACQLADVLEYLMSEHIWDEERAASIGGKSF